MDDMNQAQSVASIDIIGSNEALNENTINDPASVHVPNEHLG